MSALASIVEARKRTEEGRFLRLAIDIRERMKSTFHDSWLPSSFTRQAFTETAEIVDRLKIIKIAYLTSPALSPSWRLHYRGKTYIVLSGDAPSHFSDGIALIGQEIWYTMTGDNYSRSSREFGRLFRSLLLCGVSH